MSLSDNASHRLGIALADNNAGQEVVTALNTPIPGALTVPGLLTAQAGFQLGAEVILTAAGGLVMTAAQAVAVINKASGAATAVTLPPTPVSGQVVIVKDGKGDAAANNITVSPAAGNIDGQASHVLNVNYACACYVYNGTQWNLLFVNTQLTTGATVLGALTAAATTLGATTATTLAASASLSGVKLNIGPAPTDTYGSAMTIDVTKSLHVIAGVNGTSAAVTMTPSAPGTAGDVLTIITAADASGTVTATFASTFHSSGTQATTGSHFSTIEFISDGTRWLETKRTTALA